MNEKAEVDQSIFDEGGRDSPNLDEWSEYEAYQQNIELKKSWSSVVMWSIALHLVVFDLVMGFNVWFHIFRLKVAISPWIMASFSSATVLIIGALAFGMRGLFK